MVPRRIVGVGLGLSGPSDPCRAGRAGRRRTDLDNITGARSGLRTSPLAALLRLRGKRADRVMRLPVPPGPSMAAAATCAGFSTPDRLCLQTLFIDGDARTSGRVVLALVASRLLGWVALGGHGRKQAFLQVADHPARPDQLFMISRIPADLVPLWSGGLWYHAVARRPGRFSWRLALILAGIGVHGQWSSRCGVARSAARSRPGSNGASRGWRPVAAKRSIGQASDPEPVPMTPASPSSPRPSKLASAACALHASVLGSAVHVRSAVALEQYGPFTVAAVPDRDWRARASGRWRLRRSRVTWRSGTRRFWVSSF